MMFFKSAMEHYICRHVVHGVKNDIVLQLQEYVRDQVYIGPKSPTLFPELIPVSVD